MFYLPVFYIMMKNNYLRLQSKSGNLYMPVFIFIAMLFLFSSCKVTQQSAYFKTLQKDTTLKNFVTNDLELKIIKGDRLSINVSSMSQSEDAFFNAVTSVSAGGGSATSIGGYNVQQDGTVLLHRLGVYKVEGFTRRELSKKIETSLLPYMKDPIVQVNFLNHKITLLGEVVTPQVLNLPEEQISIIDALVLGGDLKPNAKRNNITIIRENGNDKEVKHINLEDHSIFSSPWYYVKPNDIILVAADTEKYLKEEKRQKLQTTLSLVASGVSLLVIIISQIVK
jgi:polysaccharide biosynthesis/export protein